VLWHIVKFIYPADVDEAARKEAEDGVRGLADAIDEIAFLRLGRSISEPNVSAVVVGFADEAGLAAYNAHPAHVPVAERIDGLCERVERVDILTDDAPGSIPRLA